MCVCGVVCVIWVLFVLFYRGGYDDMGHGMRMRMWVLGFSFDEKLCEEETCGVTFLPLHKKMVLYYLIYNSI